MSIVDRKAEGSRVVVIGVGNAVRGDDGAGLAVTAILRRSGMRGVHIVDEDRDGFSIIEHWREADTVILIDAIVSGAPPGTVHRLNLLHDALPAWTSRHSTHLLSIADAVNLARTLHQLPSDLRLIGIEGSAFDIGRAMTEVVQQAAHSVAAAIIEELSSRSRAEHQPISASHP